MQMDVPAMNDVVNERASSPGGVKIAAIIMGDDRWRGQVIQTADRSRYRQDSAVVTRGSPGDALVGFGGQVDGWSGILQAEAEGNRDDRCHRLRFGGALLGQESAGLVGQPAVQTTHQYAGNAVGDVVIMAVSHRGGRTVSADKIRQKNRRW